MTLFRQGDYLNNQQYKIIRLLGAGGFGVTYLADDRKNNQKVVLKFLNIEQIVNDGKGETFAQRQDDFINEAMTLASFVHPYIVKSETKIISIELNKDLKKATDETRLRGMVMKYIEGNDLTRHLRDNGIFSEAEALKIIKQIGSALDYIHQEKKLLHRDVKPQNIMIRKSNGDAVLIDFGLARKFSMAESMTMTSAMTPAFAPPEQFEEKARFTPALDIYSLAATLYVLVAVKRSPYSPLPSPYLTSLIMMQNKMSLTSPKELNPQLSDKITKGILWGMEFDATKRPQNMNQWFEALGIQSTSTPKARQWYADLEDKDNKGWLDYDECENFPPEELRIIDKLWLKYSNNHFGFSVQKEIYLKYKKNSQDSDWDCYKKMYQEIGWLEIEVVKRWFGLKSEEKNIWIEADAITFTKNAPRGHLPSVVLKCGFCVVWEEVGDVGLWAHVDEWFEVWGLVWEEVLGESTSFLFSKL